MLLFNDLILYRSQSGIAGYAAELLRHLQEVAPEFPLSRLGNTLLGRPLVWASQSVSRQPQVKSSGHGFLDRYVRTAFRFSNYSLYHEPDLIPLAIPAKTLVTVHDLSVLLFPQWHPEYRVRKYNEALTGAVKKIDHYIAVSEATKRDLQKLLGVANEKITVIGEAPRSSIKCTHEKREDFILSVGTIEPRKNIAGLIRAYRKLPGNFRKQHPLLMAGTLGWHSEEIAELLSQGDDIQHLGFVDDNRLSSLLSRARVVVYPSYYEGFGLPPLEAMACGAPVIASREGSLEEVLGEAVYYIDPHDEQSLTTAMQRMVEDTELAAELTKKGIDQVQKWSWSRAAQETLALYQRLTT